MSMLAVLHNPVFWAAMIGWSLAQFLKPIIGYLQRREWDWALLLRAGGMPSSHSALVAATAHAIGLYEGFETSLFALAVAVAVVVIYDATGIRREAGKHAALINAIIQDLREGHPLREETQKQLKEVLGHTPLEAFAGTLLGIAIAQVLWFVWGV